mgnify:FL=1|jgi:hypothetical protein
MLVQIFVVGMIVGACMVYVAWRLMPSTARRRIAMALLRLPLPALLAAPLRRASRVANACGCEACDGVVREAPAPKEQRVRFHPRRR